MKKDQKRPVLVSACLLGNHCKYNGGNNLNDAVVTILADEQIEIIPICPESEGDLPIPRDPSEIKGERVLSKSGLDVTAAFEKGAKSALYRATKTKAQAALLKNGSPSCGSSRIYDGTFTGTKIPGMGITAKALRDAGLAVFSEENLDDFCRWLEEN